MMLDILLNDLPSHTIADRAGEISVLPQLASPQSFLQSRELAEQLPRADALYNPNPSPMDRRGENDTRICIWFSATSISVISIHTRRISPELLVPLAPVSLFQRIYPSDASDTIPSGSSCRRPHDSTSSVPCFILHHCPQGPMRIRETSRLPYNPPCKACIHPRGKPRGILQSIS